MQNENKSRIDLDIRFFKRYPKEVSLQFSFKNASFHAKTIDYSFNGVSILIENGPPLQIGDIIDLTIDDLKILQKGKIQWTKKAGFLLRVGILKLGSVKGSFTHYQLSDILIGLQKTLKTGVFDVVYGSINKKIYIKNGNMVFATSNQPGDSLGNILFRYKMISKEQFYICREIQKKTGKRFTAILVDLGYLKPSELKAAKVHYWEHTCIKRRRV
jgi:hypothetical protein